MNEPKKTGHLFVKGQSGNPKGRPKGRLSGKETRDMALYKDGSSARKLLVGKSVAITAEVIRIALSPDGDNGPSKAKISCLLACLDRIVPSLKVVELGATTDGKRVEEMQDIEILQLMEKMVTLAQSGGSNPGGGQVH